MSKQVKTKVIVPSKAQPSEAELLILELLAFIAGTIAQVAAKSMTFSYSDAIYNELGRLRGHVRKLKEQNS